MRILPFRCDGLPGVDLRTSTARLVSHLYRERAYNSKYSRRVGLESTTAQRQHRPVLRQVPDAMAGLQELILRRRVVHQVGDPTVPFFFLTPIVSNDSYIHYIVNMLDFASPSRLNLRCVVFRLLVVDPSCPD